MYSLPVLLMVQTQERKTEVGRPWNKNKRGAGDGGGGGGSRILVKRYISFLCSIWRCLIHALCCMFQLVYLPCIVVFNPCFLLFQINLQQFLMTKIFSVGCYQHTNCHIIVNCKLTSKVDSQLRSYCWQWFITFCDCLLLSKYSVIRLFWTVCTVTENRNWSINEYVSEQS